MKISIVAKLGNMRKEVEWTVYPPSENGNVMIQSNTRIASFHPGSGLGVMSKHCPNGARFLHLTPSLGATVIQVPPEVVAAALTVQPKSGQTVFGGCLTIA